MFRELHKGWPGLFQSIIGFLLLYSWCSLLALIGCKQGAGTQGEPSALRQFWISYFETGLSKGHFREENKGRVSALLAELRTSNKVVSPRLLSASWISGEPLESAQMRLIFFDPEGDVSGFVVEEKDTTIGISLREVYVLYPRGRGKGSWLDSIVVEIKDRGKGQRQNVSEWHNYVERGIIRRDQLPQIYVSMPTHTRTTHVAVIRSDGRVSPPLPLAIDNEGSL